MKSVAVLVIFQFPSSSHHSNYVKPRPLPKKRPPPTETCSEIVAKKEKQVPAATSPTKEELKMLLEQRNEKISELQRKVKGLQQKVRRNTTKMATMNGVIGELRERCLVSPSVASILESEFSGLSGEIIRNYFSNKDKKPQGHRHNDDAKRFAMTVHFYSPRAYEYIRKIFDLPHPRSISAWTSSVSCEPGFFKDVFNHLKELAISDAVNRDCALIFDGMAICQGTSFSKLLGQMEGFVDLGDGIIPCSDHDDDGDDDDDKLATEALIFLLSALKSHWKYPIGYVLINKIDAETQKSLDSGALESSVEAGLNVKTRQGIKDGNKLSANVPH